MKWILIVALGFSSTSWATGKHLPSPIVRTETVYVHDTDRDGYLVGALIVAGVTYWLMHRRAKRRSPDVRIVPAECPVVQCPQVPTCDVQMGRMLLECARK